MYEMKNEYLTGIASIDEEHTKLFEIAEEVYQLQKNEFMVDKYDQVKRVLLDLKEYALVHFEHEEEYMKSINYKHMFMQKVQHDIFRQKMENLNLDLIDETADEMVTEILGVLTDWLVNHILENDKLIAE